MPELPEVETIRIGLNKKIIGLKIKNVEILSPKSFIGNPEKIQGRKVLNIWRKAKILGINLGNLSLLIHLKMTGQLIYESQVARVKSLGKNKKSLDSRFSTLDSRFVGGHPTPDMVGPLPNKSTRVIFTFSDPLRPRSEASNSKLYFNDQRRFGWIRVISNKNKELSDKLFKNLGPEPLEKGFTWQILKSNLLNHKSMPIKVALMDQAVVSGIGNIYANEACFNAKLDPKTKVGDLDDKGFQKLHRGVIRVIKDGIRYGGASRAHFVDSDGHKGYFLDYAYVYGRNKHPCKICKTEIKKIQLGGRGTYWCSKCQKK